VVTGLGAVSPLGLDMQSSWEGLLAGRSVTEPITRFDASEFLTRFACEVKDFDIFEYDRYIKRKDARRLDRFMQFAIAVAAQALEDAGLVIDDSLADDTGVYFGCGIGGLETIHRGYESLNTKGPMRVSPFVATYMLPKHRCRPDQHSLRHPRPKPVHHLRLCNRHTRHRRSGRGHPTGGMPRSCWPAAEKRRSRRSLWPPFTGLKPFPNATTIQNTRAARSTPNGMASYSPKVQPCSCWRTWSSPWLGAQHHWPKCSVMAQLPMPTT